MSKALMPVRLQAEDWQLIRSIAVVAQESREFGVREQEVAMKMLVAWEHGVPITSALSTVYIIDKKPSIAPKLTWAKIVGHPELAEYKEERLASGGKFYGWKITLRRTNGVGATRRFTLDDATRAGLIDKTNWKTYPEQVCYWRALGYVQDVVFADVSQGLYRPEELGAEVDESGEPTLLAPAEDAPKVYLETGVPLDDTVTVSGGVIVPHPITYEETIAVQPDLSELTLTDLLEAGWTAEQIVVAGEGRIPADSEECRAVKAKLEATSG